MRIFPTIAFFNLLLLPIFAHSALFFEFDWQNRQELTYVRADLHLRLSADDLTFEDESGQCRALIEARVEFRNERGYTVKATQWISRVSQPDVDAPSAFLRIYRPFILPQGEYDASIELIDRATGVRAVRRSRLSVPRFRDRPTLSDLLLLDEAAQSPLVYNHLSFDAPRLAYQFYVHSAKRADLSLRAILFRKENQPNGSSAQKYVSALQQTRALNVTGGGQSETGSFETDGLEAGEYLIELYLLENGQVIAESGKTVFLEWRGLKRIRQNLDEAIEQMRWIAPPETLSALLVEKDQELKRERFLAFWQSLNANADDEPARALTEYYRRVNEVNEKFTENRPGWLTDRGQTVLRYGFPNRITQAAPNRQIWLYTNFNLLLVFEKNADSYRLKKV